jgi:UDP-MurNAc hydroxylase
MKQNIEFNFINHSSFSIKKDDTILTVDPWIDGYVFNNSWKLLTKTPTKMIDIVKKSNYVWFSHEHPDHFNPPNLNIFNNNTNFIFQKTKDKRVIKFLKKISKKVIEAESKESINLTNDFSLQVFPFQDLDSFCLITVNGIKILNLNDCDIKNLNELDEIRSKVGHIDVLLAQFSYAIGKSNLDEVNQRKLLSKNILKNLSETINYFKPNFFIPFASFCYFSHTENFYLNDSINKIDHVIDYLSKNSPQTKSLVFYPGDKWNFSHIIDNSSAITKYLNDYIKISPTVSNNKKTNLDKLSQTAYSFIKKTKDNNNMFFFYDLVNFRYHNIIFKIIDLNIYLKFDFKSGLTLIDNAQLNNAICELSSDSLFQLFNSGYGYDALMIGGRFQVNKFGHKSLNKIFKFQTKNYQNQFYDFGNILRKFFNRLSKTSRVNPVR